MPNLTEEEKHAEVIDLLSQLGTHMQELFPEHGFALTIFDHFSYDILGFVANSDDDLSLVFNKMAQLTSKPPERAN